MRHVEMTLTEEEIQKLKALKTFVEKNLLTESKALEMLLCLNSEEMLNLADNYCTIVQKYIVIVFTLSQTRNGLFRHLTVWHRNGTHENLCPCNVDEIKQHLGFKTPMENSRVHLEKMTGRNFSVNVIEPFHLPTHEIPQSVN